MPALASDVNNPDFVGATNPDAALAVRFYNHAVQNQFETGKQNRPIFQDVVYVEIFRPGDPTTVINTPARDDHKRRFPLHWAHYQNAHGGDAREIGTPLTQWPLLTSAQVEELRALKFFTVEQIANASDAQIQNIGMIGGMGWHAFRTRATTYLQAARDSALPQRQAEEIEKLREEQKVKDEQHEKDLAEMKAQISALSQAPQKRKPGRPAKAVSG